MIDIFVPVLGRPQNAKLVADSISQSTAVDFSLVFICTKGDYSEITACKKTGARIMVIQGGRSEYPRKMNHAFRKTDREWVFLGADDLIFEKGWDTEALKMATARVGVVGTSDCHNPAVMRGDFATHPLIRRSYVMDEGASMDGPGVLCHEGYDHNLTDVEISKLAQARGRWAFAPESRICHNHPDWLDMPKDATYHKGFRFWRRDQQLWRKRSRHLP